MRFVSAAAFALVLAPALHAQDRGYWHASSKTARSVTGDISITELRVVLNFAGYTIAQIRSVEQGEAAAVFSDLDGTPTTGNLYRLVIPGGKQILRHQTICGAEDTQWMVTAVEGKTLRVAFFSGSSMPALTPEGMADATTLCGTYTYVR